MRNLKKHLHEGDPVPSEPDLSAETTDVMRRAVVSAATAPQLTNASPGALVVGLTIACALAVGIFIGRNDIQREVPVTQTAPAQPTVRQVQFETAGGTRIIWVLKSD